MLFNSYSFLLFLPIVVLIYFCLPMKVRYIWLLVTSYYFYMCWNPVYALLLLFSTVVTFLSGILIDRVTCKKAIVAASVILNLGILFYFKYMNFAAELAAQLCSALRIQMEAPKFDILLPVGISFYTFQALSYTMDVYRGEIPAEKNPLRYALFVSFFPQLVAGPIERSKNIIPQLYTPKEYSYDNFREGVLLMLWGYFLKIVLADRIAMYVDHVFDNYQKLPGPILVIAVMLFAIQIYCDFGGYSTIAMGAARIMGIQLMENFNAPYLASTVADFWRRWHISLTGWFRDYVYFPLGGSRCGRVRKYLNQFLVFFISGLWHGAGLNFVLWGALNGIYQIVGDLLMPIRKAAAGLLHLKTDHICHKIFGSVITFILVDFSWLFFRASSTGEALEIIKRIFTETGFSCLTDGQLFKCGLNERQFFVLLIGILILALADIFKANHICIRHILMKQNYFIRCILVAMIIFFILTFGVWGKGYNEAAFIYFQF